MTIGVLHWMAVLLVAAATVGMLLSRDWRWNLGQVAMTYVGAAVLLSAHWPTGMATAVLVAGWMSIACLGMTLTNFPFPLPAEHEQWPQGRLFRLLMAGMVLVLAAGLGSRADAFVPGIEVPVTTGAVLLTGMGFLQLGTSAVPYRVILGLLLVISGFEVFYAAVESSILVAGMLSAISLGLGLVGAYLLTLSQAEEAG